MWPPLGGGRKRHLPFSLRFHGGSALLLPCMIRPVAGTVVAVGRSLQRRSLVSTSHRHHQLTLQQTQLLPRPPLHAQLVALPAAVGAVAGSPCRAPPHPPPHPSSRPSRRRIAAAASPQARPCAAEERPRRLPARSQACSRGSTEPSRPSPSSQSPAARQDTRQHREIASNVSPHASPPAL